MPHAPIDMGDGLWFEPYTGSFFSNNVQPHEPLSDELFEKLEAREPFSPLSQFCDGHVDVFLLAAMHMDEQKQKDWQAMWERRTREQEEKLGRPLSSDEHLVFVRVVNEVEGKNPDWNREYVLDYLSAQRHAAHLRANLPEDVQQVEQRAARRSQLLFKTQRLLTEVFEQHYHPKFNDKSVNSLMKLSESLEHRQLQGNESWMQKASHFFSDRIHRRKLKAALEDMVAAIAKKKFSGFSEDEVAEVSKMSDESKAPVDEIASVPTFKCLFLFSAGW